MNDIELELTEVVCMAGNSDGWMQIPGIDNVISDNLNLINRGAVKENSDIVYYLNSLNNGYAYKIYDISTPMERDIFIERYIVASAISKDLKKNLIPNKKR